VSDAGEAGVNPVVSSAKSASMAAAMATDTPPSGVAPVPKILVVDDEPNIRDLLRDVLTQAGYKVLTAGDGREALPMTLSEQPDLILTDIRMPKLDGLTLCKALRVNTETKNIPVIILTSYNTSEHLEAAMAAGAEDFLAKPLNVEEIKIRVRSLLKLKHVTDEVQRLQQYVLELKKQAESGN
jgi:two-component system, OmpR family, alkaline phosphatase synthesis response regulator PhoP